MRIKTSNGAIINVNNIKRSITIEGIELGSDCRALVSKHRDGTGTITIDTVYTLSTSVQTKTMEKITTQTKDGQWLNTNIDVKYRVNKEKVMTIFSNYTKLENVNESVIDPAVQRAIESVTGNYDIYDILGNKRTEVYEEIDKALKEKFESQA